MRIFRLTPTIQGKLERLDLTGIFTTPMEMGFLLLVSKKGLNFCVNNAKLLDR